MKTFLIALALLLSGQIASGQTMLIVINGREVSSDRMKDFTSSEGDKMQIIRDPEKAVAQFGEKARGGVCALTLSYDTPALFTASPKPYARYLYESIEGWSTTYVKASISLMCKISPEGKLSISEVKISDNKELLEKIKAFIEATPAWAPAMKDGEPVESCYLLKIIANK